MKRFWVVILFLFGLILVGRAVYPAADASVQGVLARAEVNNADGKNIGWVAFTEQNGKVRVSANLKNLTPGFHGFHIHAFGSCAGDADNPFTGAGGHFDTEETKHPNHAGDMPVLHVNQDGTANLMFTTDRFDIADLLVEHGTAVIVHSHPDNFSNIPRPLRWTGPHYPRSG